MKSVAHKSTGLLFPLLLLAAVLGGPVGALTFNQKVGPVLDKQGAGLVLYVSLQRNAMN